MMFISAFLLGGILCALFEIFAMFTKLAPPKVLILGFTLGALLTPYGMTAALAGWGGAGLAVMVMNAGNAVTGATLALLGGDPMPFIITLGIFAALTIIGVVSGYIRTSVLGNQSKGIQVKNNI